MVSCKMTSILLVALLTSFGILIAGVALAQPPDGMVLATRGIGRVAYESNTKSNTIDTANGGPVVTNISPSLGTTAGGCPVVVTGEGFSAGSTLTIGGNPAEDVVVVSSTNITAVTPTGSAPQGTPPTAQTVVVTDPYGMSSEPAAIFTYVLPGDSNDTVSTRGSDGEVGINEVADAAHMFLSYGALRPEMDSNCDGKILINELQQTVNSFFGLPSRSRPQQPQTSNVQVNLANPSTGNPADSDPIVAVPDSEASLNVVLQSDGNSVAAIGIDLDFNPAVFSWFSCIVDSLTLEKQCSQQYVSLSTYRIGVWHLNQQLIRDGLIGTVKFNIAADAAPGDYTLTNTPSSSGPSGEAITTTGNNATIRVRANLPPLVVSVEAQIVNEGQTLLLTFNASDPDGDATVLSANGLPHNASFNPETGEFSFTPDFTQAGTYRVAFCATDVYGLSGCETVNIMVNNVPQCIFADVDCNEVVNILDAIRVLGISTGVNEVPQCTSGDLNCDGAVNILDMTKVMRISIGLE